MRENIRQKTAQQIVETVKDVCGQHVNFIGDKGTIIASTDSNRVNTFHEIGRQVILTGNTIEVAEDNSFYGTNKGVNIPITHNGAIIAAIGISGDPEIVRKYAYLAQRITLLILREQDLDYQSNSMKNRLNYIMRSIINNDTVSHQYFSEFLSEYRVSADDLYYTAVVSLDSRYHHKNPAMIEQQIYQTFDMTGSVFYTFQYPNEYILFLRESDCKSKSCLLKRLAEAFPHILKIGIGCLQPLHRQSLSYQCAKLTIKSLISDQAFGLYDELNLELALGSIPSNVQELFVQKILGKLCPEDLTLLTIYYEENMSLSQTCEKLFLHKNTLQYKLDRIKRLSGYNPRSFQDAAILYSAVKIQALLIT